MSITFRPPGSDDPPRAPAPEQWQAHPEHAQHAPETSPQPGAQTPHASPLHRTYPHYPQNQSAPEDPAGLAAMLAAAASAPPQHGSAQPALPDPAPTPDPAPSAPAVASAAPAETHAAPPPRPLPSPPAPVLKPLSRPARALLWITSPSMIKGMALGIALAMVASLTLRLDALWYIASGIMMIAVALLVGAVVGNYVYESQKSKLVNESGAYLRSAGDALSHISDGVVAAIVKKDRSHIANIRYELERIGPVAQRFAQLAVAFMFRAMAMSSLFAVLGGVVSFAVFLASYMQVERMTEQNRLIGEQTTLIKDQMDLIKAQNEKIDQDVAERKRANDIRIAISLSEQRRKPMLDLLGEIAPEISDAAIPIDILGARERTCGNHRIELSPRIYRRIRTTLPYLAPYRSIDLNSLDLSDEVRSPEQEELLNYLIDADVDLGGVDRFVFDIPRAQLAGLDFTTSRPNLHGSRLARADLRDADLHCAALVGVDLSGATLHRAKLSGVDLSGAKLVGADLTLVNLRGAKGLTPEQVTQAEHWWLAQYDAALAKQLGLSKELIEYTTPRVTNAPAYRAGQHAFDEYISAVQTGAPPPPSATP